MLLIGDIGGTRTDPAVLSAEGGPGASLVQKWFLSRDYPELADIAREFLATVDLSVKHACLGVAGRGQW